VQSGDTATTSALLSIGAGAFLECSSLVEVEFPASVHNVSGSGSRLDRGAFEGCTNLRTLILPPALTSLGAAAFRYSTANLQMLVVPRAVPDHVATAVAAMVGPRAELCPGAVMFCTDQPAVSSVQLVSAPDVVVASLGGLFAEMTTMAEVRATRRDIASVLDIRYWTIKTHRHQVCESGARVCAHTVLLVGARLSSRTVQAQASKVVRKVPLLPLPNELWVGVLTWLQRVQLGGCV
jgi:hypothetical protein